MIPRIQLVLAVLLAFPVAGCGDDDGIGDAATADRSSSADSVMGDTSANDDAGPGPVRNLDEEEAYFSAHFVPLDEAGRIQELIDEHGAVRLGAGDYGWSDAEATIRLTTGQRLYGDVSITRVPPIIIAAGSRDVEVHNVNTGYAGGSGITFEAGEAVSDCVVKSIVFSPLRATGARIENCFFANLDNVHLVWDMSEAGYFRNNRFIKHTIHDNQISTLPQILMLANESEASYGNVHLWSNYLTPHTYAADFDGIADITFVGVDTESWNWAGESTRANINMSNMGDVRISTLNAGSNRENATPVFDIEAENLIMHGIKVSSPTDEPNRVRGANLLSVSYTGDEYESTESRVLRAHHNNDNIPNLDGVEQWEQLEDAEPWASMVRGQRHTPWARPVFETPPDPIGRRWQELDFEGVEDSTAYIQGLIDDAEEEALLPEGIYYISESLIINKLRGLIGEGTGKTVIVGMSDDFPLITITQDTEGMSNSNHATVMNMTLQGGSTGILLTSEPLIGGERFGTMQWAHMRFSNIIFRDMHTGLRLYKTYGLDNNYFERLHFIHNVIGIHQEVYEGDDITYEPATWNYIDKTLFYRCQWLNNETALLLDATRASNLNAWVECNFDGNGKVAEMNNHNKGFFANSLFRNNESSDYLMGGRSPGTFYSCEFADNAAPAHFSFYYGLTAEGLVLHDEMPLTAGSALAFIRNSQIAAPIDDVFRGSFMNSSFLHNPELSRLFVIKPYMEDAITVLDEDVDPFPQFLVTH